MYISLFHLGPPLELYGDGRAQPGVGGLRGLCHLHHQCPQHVLQQTAHGSPFSGHRPGRAQWKEAQVPGPWGLGKREGLTPRGVEGDICGLVLLVGKDKESLEMVNTVLALCLTAKITQEQPVLLANWRGHVIQEVLVVVGLLIFLDIRNLALYERAPQFLMLTL